MFKVIFIYFLFQYFLFRNCSLNIFKKSVKICSKLTTEEVGQLLAKHHGKFACFSTQCRIHAWTVAKRTSLCDKEIWKLSKDRTVRLQYFEKIA